MTLSSKEKKEYAILAVLLLATFAFIYFNFLRPKNLPIVKVDTGATAPGGIAAPVYGSFLPHGTDLNLKILDDPRFKNLSAPTYPDLKAGEIGNDNLFLK